MSGLQFIGKELHTHTLCLYMKSCEWSTVIIGIVKDNKAAKEIFELNEIKKSVKNKVLI